MFSNMNKQKSFFLCGCVHLVLQAQIYYYYYSKNIVLPLVKSMYIG